MKTTYPYKIIEPQTQEDWSGELRKGLFPSEICTLSGIRCHNHTPIQIWRKKIGEIPVSAPQRSEFLQFIPVLFSSKTGMTVESFLTEKKVCASAARSWFRFLPDAFCRKSNGAEGDGSTVDVPLLCFISTSRVSDGDIPVSWIISAHYQMRVMGVPSSYVAWIESDGGISFDYTEISFNEDFWAPIEDIADRFWNEHVVKNMCPQEVVTNEDAIRAWRDATDSLCVMADDEAVKAWTRIQELKAQEKIQKEEMEDLLLLIRKKMKKADMLLGENNEPIATWKNVSAGRTFLLDRFREEHPGLYNLYLSPESQSRRLLFKKAKKSKRAA
jgi:hypothetical protein